MSWLSFLKARCWSSCKLESLSARLDLKAQRTAEGLFFEAVARPFFKHVAIELLHEETQQTTPVTKIAVLSCSIPVTEGSFGVSELQKRRQFQGRGPILPIPMIVSLLAGSKIQNDDSLRGFYHVEPSHLTAASFATFGATSGLQDTTSTRIATETSNACDCSWETYLKNC